MMDLDEVYNSTIKKTQSLLESKGIALSLREIKKLDTINLSGFRNDGERLLRLELAEKYGLEFVYRDFRVGFREGQTKARELGLYMQKYCGCIFSEEDRYSKKIEKDKLKR